MERQLRCPRRECYWPLSYIDDVNGVRVGGEKEIDCALEEAANEGQSSMGNYTEVGQTPELVAEDVEEWTDGSWLEERAAGATRSAGTYLGMMATVVDAEEMGVAMAWEYCDTVALDSQGVITRIQDLAHLPPRSWIEERLVSQMAERPRRLGTPRRVRQRGGRSDGEKESVDGSADAHA